MSVKIDELTTKIKKTQSTNTAEEFLVERYESLVYRLEILTLLSRWSYVCILFVAIILRIVYFPSVSIYYFNLAPFIGIILWYMISTVSMDKRISSQINISNLEREILKIQLAKGLQSDTLTKNKIEDLYIKFNTLINRKKWVVFRIIPVEYALYYIFFSIIIFLT